LTTSKEGLIIVDIQFIISRFKSGFGWSAKSMAYARYYLGMKDFTIICIFISTICITECCYIKTSVIFINLKSYENEKNQN